MTLLTVMPVSALKDNYIWLAINPVEQVALIVDPGEAEPVIAYLQKHKIKPVAILITHHHWDHTHGTQQLQSQYHLSVYGANPDVKGLTDLVCDGDVIKINFAFAPIDVMSIPGHTLDHTAYYFSESLFCGDTLFSAGCGRLFEGNPEQLFTSLQKLAELPDQTKVYCAHEYTEANLRFAKTVDPTNPAIDVRIDEVENLRAQGLPTLPSTMAIEKAINPFLRCHLAEIKKQVELHSSKTLTTPLEVFTELRKWKDNF